MVVKQQYLPEPTLAPLQHVVDLFISGTLLYWFFVKQQSLLGPRVVASHFVVKLYKGILNCSTRCAFPDDLPSFPMAAFLPFSRNVRQKCGILAQLAIVDGVDAAFIKDPSPQTVLRFAFLALECTSIRLETATTKVEDISEGLQQEAKVINVSTVRGVRSFELKPVVG